MGGPGWPPAPDGALRLVSVVFGVEEAFCLELTKDAQRQLRECVEWAMDVLTVRERYILVFRYGLGSIGCGALTAERVAQRLGMTPGQVREIAGKAVRKLRRRVAEHPSAPAYEPFLAHRRHGEDA